MLEYAEKMRNVEETFEREKQRQLAEVQKALANERKRRKKALHMKQVREAQEAGLDPDKVCFFFEKYFPRDKPNFGTLSVYIYQSVNWTRW